MFPFGCSFKVADRIDEKLEAIHTHAVKTNGRVTRLEKWNLVFITALTVSLATNPDGLLYVLKLLLSWMQ